MRVHAYKSIPLTLALGAGVLVCPFTAQATPRPKEAAPSRAAANNHAVYARTPGRAKKPAERLKHPAGPVHLERSETRKSATPTAKSMMPAATPAEPLVVHDRKQHYAAVASSAATSDPTPRKATTADFLAPLQPAAVQPAANPVTASRAITTSQPLAAPILREAAAVPANQAARNAVQPKPILPTVRTPVAIAEKPAPIPPTVEPTLFTRNGRLILPPPLKGSHEILLRQNQVADREGLDRIQDDEDLERLRSAHLLVPIPVSTGIDADERLPANRRYVRPWTAQFLATLARAHYARFHSPLQVNSAVRTVEFQARLQLTNGNAAPAEGDTASPHLTGQAVDLAKHGLSLTEIAWMRGYLLPLVQEGKVDVEEEFQQACFHISVYKSYLPPPAQRRTLATAHHPNTALATAIR